MKTRWPTDASRLERMSIIEEGSPRRVRMANLATVGSHSVNGVAQLHTQLLQRSVLADFHQLMPDRFNNKTNGVSPRRWLLYSNPRLTRLVSSRLGSEWIDRDLRQLKQVERFSDDVPFLEALAAVKQDNKRDLAVLVQRRIGVELPTDAMFVVQIKRIHEYKRQLLACLQVIAHYLALKNNAELDAVPRVYLFGGKAAAGYAMAKLHIRLINDVAAVINGDPEMRGRLAVAFIPNYGVTLAQSIIPAADVSVQIATAGTEASGTSNMKFALNGALTVGTLDGANVELRQAVGPENFFLFGLDTEQVAAVRAEGYDPRAFIDRSPALREALALIESGFFSLGEPDRYRPVLDSLRYEDRYLVCADFDAYVAAEARAAEAYRDRIDWSRRGAAQHRRRQSVFGRRHHPSIRRRHLGRPSGDRRSGAADAGPGDVAAIGAAAMSWYEQLVTGTSVAGVIAGLALAATHRPGAGRDQAEGLLTRCRRHPVRRPRCFAAAVEP